MLKLLNIGVLLQFLLGVVFFSGSIAFFYLFLFDIFYEESQKKKISREGIKSKAIYYQIEFENKCRGKGIKTCRLIPHRKGKYWHEQDEKMYAISLKDPYPLLDIMTLEQPFLISYLPDDHGWFSYTYQHDFANLKQVIEGIKELSATHQAVIKVEPVTLSQDGERGYALLRVGNGMLKYPWYQHPDVAEKAKQLLLQKTGSTSAFSRKECNAFLGMADSDSLHSISTINHRFPQNWVKWQPYYDGKEPVLPEGQDRVAALNLVSGGEKASLRLKCRVVDKKDTWLMNIQADFVFTLPVDNRLDLTPSDATSVAITGVKIPAPSEDELSMTRKRAELGDAEAQYSLGKMYSGARGVAKDVQQAAKWYRLAAEQNHTESQNKIAAMYAKGLGVPQSYEESARWFRLAAEKNHATSQVILGMMYLHGGPDIPKDLVQAYLFVNLAIENGYNREPELLNSLISKMTAEQIEVGQKLLLSWKEETLSAEDRADE